MDREYFNQALALSRLMGIILLSFAVLALCAMANDLMLP